MTNRRTIELVETQWRALETLAEQLGAVPLRGPKPPKPSWRMLVRMIADGDLIITRPTGKKGKKS